MVALKVATLKRGDEVNDPGKTTVVTADELKAMSRLDLDALESEVKSTGVFKHLAENPELHSARSAVMGSSRAARAAG
jgi:hypothetical protein